MASARPHPSLYFITDRSQTAGRSLVDVVTAAVAGGVDAVQLREKDLSTRDLVALARELLTICRRYGARLLINDRIDVAVVVGADGVHLPAASFACVDARRLLPHQVVGVSTHNAAEVAAAAREGADFAVLGPIFATPSKAAYGPPLGLDCLAEACRSVDMPVLAVGGIGSDETVRVLQAGAAGVALVRGISESPDPGAAATALRRRMGGSKVG